MDNKGVTVNLYEPRPEGHRCPRSHSTRCGIKEKSEKEAGHFLQKYVT